MARPVIKRLIQRRFDGRAGREKGAAEEWNESAGHEYWLSCIHIILLFPLFVNYYFCRKAR